MPRTDYRGIDEVPLISKPDLSARLAAHRRPGRKLKFVPELTLADIARWCGTSYTTLDRGAKGTCPISDRMQIVLTQFYHMLDTGILRLEVHGKHKHLVRPKPGEAPPVPPKQDPRVEFGPMGPVLKI